MNDADLGKITQWLQQQGLQVVSVARGRNWIAVSGTAAQVESAFQTEIHNYLVDGETHYANASAPSVPAAFGSVVKSIRGLNDFRMKPRLRAPSSKANSAKPNYTTGQGTHYIAPDDLATIYDVTPLYNAGINGTGQKIAIAGQIQVNLSDIEAVPQQIQSAGQRSADGAGAGLEKPGKQRNLGRPCRVRPGSGMVRRGGAQRNHHFCLLQRRNDIAAVCDRPEACASGQRELWLLRAGDARIGVHRFRPVGASKPMRKE